MKNNVSKKIIRLIRFCKNNDLYLYVIAKYKTIKFLSDVLKGCSAEKCFIRMITFTPLDFNSKNVKLNEDVDILLLSYEWKKFVKDLIEAEEKRNKMHEEMIKTLQSINNSYPFVFPRSYVPSYLQEDNYEDDSDYGGLVDYFNFLKNV